jgi:surface protein
MADVIEITIPNGITYSLKDATAVKFVEQSLTDAQKAQARKNIGAKSDTGELVLGYISGIVPDGTNGYDVKFGFKDLGLATNNTTSISFGSISSWSLDDRYKIVPFEDFVGVLWHDTDTYFNLGPLPDRTDGISLTGQWIHVKGCYSMFNGCKGLTSLDLSAFDTSKVKTMYSMFSGCSGLTSLNVSTFDTSNVINMNSMFSGCSGLTSLDLSSFRTSKVENMSGMFAFCSGLTSLNLSTFETSKVKPMGSMFNGCSSLTSLDISNFDMSNVTNAYNMFTNTTALTVLKTPKINPITNIALPKTMYTRSGTAYNNLPVTTGTSIELRTSWN